MPDATVIRAREAGAPGGGRTPPRPPPVLHRRGHCRSGRLRRGDGRRHVVKREPGRGKARDEGRDSFAGGDVRPALSPRQCAGVGRHPVQGPGRGQPVELPGRGERGVRGDRAPFGEDGEGVGKAPDVALASGGRLANWSSASIPWRGRTPARVSRLTHKCPGRVKRKIMTAPRVALTDCALPPSPGG